MRLLQNIISGKKNKDKNMARPNTIIRSIEINRTLDKLLEDGHVDEYFVESIRDLIIMARR